MESDILEDYQCIIEEQTTDNKFQNIPLFKVIKNEKCDFSLQPINSQIVNSDNKSPLNDFAFTIPEELTNFRQAYPLGKSDSELASSLFQTLRNTSLRFRLRIR